MCEKTINAEEFQNELDHEAETWAEDQQKRGYYYDDAHGYEIYKDEEDEDDTQK